MIRIAYEPQMPRVGTRPIVQLLTNPDALACCPSRLSHEASGEARIGKTDAAYLVAAREYLASVLSGNGKPYCPFVRFIEENNGYHLVRIPDGPSSLDLDALVPEMSSCFRRLSPLQTCDGQQPDRMNLVAVFSNPEMMSQEACSLLDAARDRHRQDILEQGLMLSQMHPFHPRFSVNLQLASTPLYSAGIPLLVIRRMHAQDHVFMHTPEARDAYHRFFPS